GAAAGRGGAAGGGGAGGAGGLGGAAGANFSMAVKPSPVNGASTVTDPTASGGSSVGLASSGNGAQATALPAATTLAIHYASVSVGTISVSVNGGAAVKVNVHSTGATTGSFIY